MHKNYRNGTLFLVAIIFIGFVIWTGLIWDFSASKSQHNNILLWSDSAAQWIIAISSITALLISIWAVWLLKQTLIATNKALRQSEKATKAAFRTVKVTKRIGQAQVRAYLSVARCKLVRISSNRFTVKLRVANSGQSPAKAIIIKADLYIHLKTLDSNGNKTTQTIVGMVNDGEELGVDYRASIPAVMRFEANITLAVEEEHVAAIESAQNILYRVAVDFECLDVFKKKEIGGSMFRKSVSNHIGIGNALRLDYISDTFERAEIRKMHKAADDGI